MQTEQKGERIITLKNTISEITAIYDLACPTGIHSMKFLNSKTGLKNIRSRNWKRNFNSRNYDGMTRIGTTLQKKILDQFVWRAPMLKPLLVIIVTDGEVCSTRLFLFIQLIASSVQG